jgi:RNA polymerase primary sigma factor
VRLPENITASLTRLRKASLELERALGRTPTAHEVADELEISTKEVEQLHKLTHDARPLDAIHEGEGGGPGAVIPDLGTPTPLDSIMQRQLQDDVAEALELLSTRDRQIVCLRFGIGHERRHTLEQIARMFDLSREGIRLIERRALKALQSARGFLIEHLMRRTDRPLAAVRSVDD